MLMNSDFKGLVEAVEKRFFELFPTHEWVGEAVNACYVISTMKELAKSCNIPGSLGGETCMGIAMRVGLTPKAVARRADRPFSCGCSPWNVYHYNDLPEDWVRFLQPTHVSLEEIAEFARLRPDLRSSFDEWQAEDFDAAGQQNGMFLNGKFLYYVGGFGGKSGDFWQELSRYTEVRFKGERESERLEEIINDLPRDGREKDSGPYLTRAQISDALNIPIPVINVFLDSMFRGFRGIRVSSVFPGVAEYDVGLFPEDWSIKCEDYADWIKIDDWEEGYKEDWLSFNRLFRTISLDFELDFEQMLDIFSCVTVDRAGGTCEN